MRIAILGLLLSLLGSTDHRDHEFESLRDNSQNEPGATLDDNGIISIHAGPLAKIEDMVKDGWLALKGFFSGKIELPAYCAWILEESPTVEEFKRNWEQEAETDFCLYGESSAGSCQQKHAHFFAALLACYQK